PVGDFAWYDHVLTTSLLLGFDGSPVYDDTAVLNRWLDVTEKDKNSRSATFYNTLPLHDGNHYPGVSKTADYKAR
ncbi:cellulose biosynthesis protein BcsG, partial [Escherichia sp. SS-MK2]